MIAAAAGRCDPEPDDTPSDTSARQCSLRQRPEWTCCVLSRCSSSRRRRRRHAAQSVSQSVCVQTHVRAHTDAAICSQNKSRAISASALFFRAVNGKTIVCSAAQLRAVLGVCACILLSLNVRSDGFNQIKIISRMPVSVCVFERTDEFVCVCVGYE